MSKSVSNLTSNINVGMDEVVSVFLSRYEDDLYNKKENLAKNIKAVKRDLESLQKSVVAGIDNSEYEISNIQPLNIRSKVKDVSIDWNENNIVIRIIVESLDSRSYYNSGFTQTINLDISDSDVESHTELTETLERLNGEMMEVMSLIKGISRKERQVRGKIASMKLEESGYGDLLENDEMMKLIEVK